MSPVTLAWRRKVHWLRSHIERILYKASFTLEYYYKSVIDTVQGCVTAASDPGIVTQCHLTTDSDNAN